MMYISDVRTKTKSGDIILVGRCAPSIRVERHETTLTFAQPMNFANFPPGDDPVGPVKTFTAEIHQYVGRPGAYLLVQAADPVEWIPGWKPIS